MEGKQLCAAGVPFAPNTEAEKVKAQDMYGLAGGTEATVQQILDAIAERVANKLLARSDVAEWAKKADKPAYTPEEVGADAKGSAAAALEDAKGYADSTYIQATGYADQKIADLINGAPSTLDTIGEIAAAMLEHGEVVDALEAAIGSKASEIEYQAHAGNSAVHVTASKQEKWDAYEARLEEVFQSVSNGKNLVASAITDRGVNTAADAGFSEMADNIRGIALPKGNAGAAQVLAPYTFSNASGVGITGSMPNKGAVTAALNAGGSYTVPAGYHNGAGKVTANSLAAQTAGTAAAADITNGKTAWVGGKKITGTQKLGDKAKAVTWYLACEGRRDGTNTSGEDTRYGWISWFNITSLLPDYKSLVVGRDFFVIPASCSTGFKISLPFGRQVNISSGIDVNNWRASHDLENEKHYLTAENRTGGITVICLFAPSAGKVYIMTSVNGYIGNIAIIR